MRIGDVAPDFELPDDSGAMLKLSDQLAKGPVVLFFYPKAMTPGCTKESCHFRDMKGEFEAVGAQRIGISADTVDKQHQFSTKHNLKRPGPLMNKRMTFVIDTDRKVLDVIGSETNMDKHADQALEVLRARAS